MLEVQDMPESDEDEEDEEDEEEEEDDQADEHVTEGNNVAEEPFDEEAFQKQMSDRLEAMRLNRALGNDDPDELEEQDDVPSESDSESESDTDSESGDSVGPAPTEFSSFDQNRRRKPTGPKPRTKLMTRADELKLTVAQQVGKERESKEKRFHSKKSINKAGNAKGHKWKNSDAYVVGKNSGW